jgi:hypothetical protein
MVLLAAGYDRGEMIQPTVMAAPLNGLVSDAARGATEAAPSRGALGAGGAGAPVAWTEIATILIEPPRRGSKAPLRNSVIPTGLPSRPTCRGAGPLQVLKTQDSRATPGRPARFGQSTMPTSQ